MSFAIKMATAFVAIATLCQPAVAGGLTIPLVAKGCEQLNRGNYTTAINFLSAAVRQNPADLEARRHLASAFLGAGQAKDAIQQLEGIAKVAPVGVNDHLTLAEAYYQLGDTKTAVARYKEAMLLDPSSCQARMGLARALMSTGDSAAATAVCNDTLRLKKDAQSRQQFIELLSTIRSRSTIVRRQLNG